MKITFPAMRGRIGKRDYYVAMIKLNLIPKIFSFHEWAELPPEQRAQRVLQRARVPEITQYILDNEDGYLFSSLTASFDGEPSFKPSTESHEMGLLELPLESQFVINDGQHRMAAIIEAMKQNPTLGSETISVVFFPFEDLDRMQQMFSDLNRTVKVTSKSLNILYDHRDLLAQIVLEAVEKVSVFRNMVDKDRVSLPLRSPKLFTLSAIYDATQQLVGEVTHENQYDENAKITLDYWETMGANIPQWKQVLEGYLRPSELRAEYVNSHGVVLWGLGAMGKILLNEYPTEWMSRLRDLSKIDWRRINKEWDGVCMQGTEIINRRQSKNNTAAFLKNKMGLPLTPSEEKSIKPGPPENPPTGEKAGQEKFQIQELMIPSHGGVPEYVKTYREMLKKPETLPSRMKEYINEVGSITWRDLKTECVHRFGCKSPTSGSIGASLRVLALDGYVKITGRGEDRKILSTREHHSNN